MAGVGKTIEQVDSERSDTPLFLAVGRSTHGIHRVQNEDYGLVRFDPELGFVAVVADGSGASGFGEIASEAAAEAIAERIFAAFERARHVRSFDLAVDLPEAFRQANRVVLERIAANPRLAGISATAVAVACYQTQVYVAHVGNCRAYRVRSGVVDQLTTDHTIAAEMIRDGLFDPTSAMVQRYQTMVTRSIGRDLVLDPDVVRVETQTGDRLILCTDGLHGLFADHELKRHFLDHDSARSANDLIDLVRARQGTDNATVAYLEVTNEAGTIGVDQAA